jgi:hypothetical protein
MAELVDEGKVRWAGVSNFDVELLGRCQRVRHVDSLQPPYSLLDRAAAAELIPWCAGNGTGVICYSPLGSGLLSGGFDADRPATCRPATGAGPATTSARPGWRRTSGWPGGWSRWPSATGSRWRPWPWLGPGHPGGDRGDRRRPPPLPVDGWLPAGNLRLTEADLAELAER